MVNVGWLDQHIRVGAFALPGIKGLTGMLVRIQGKCWSILLKVDQHFIQDGIGQVKKQ
jgi:hypothetical protein